jgi:hypothetical protein
LVILTNDKKINKIRNFSRLNDIRKGMVPLIIGSNLVKSSNKGLIGIELGQNVLACVLKLVYVERSDLGCVRLSQGSWSGRECG